MRICMFTLMVLGLMSGLGQAQGLDRPLPQSDLEFQLRSQEELDSALIYDFKLQLTQSGTVKIAGRKKPTPPDVEFWQITAVEHETCGAVDQDKTLLKSSKTLPPLDREPTGRIPRSLSWSQFSAEKQHNGKAIDQFSADCRDDLKELGQKPQFAILGVFMRDPILYQLSDRLLVDDIETAGVFLALGARLSNELKASIASRYQLLLPAGTVRVGSTWQGRSKVQETAFDPRGSIPELDLEVEAKLLEFIEAGAQSRVVIEQLERPSQLPMTVKPRFGLPLEVLHCEQRRRFEFNLKGHLVAESTTLKCRMSSTMKIAGREAERTLEIERQVDRKLRVTAPVAEKD